VKKTKKKTITALMIATILLLSAFATLATMPKAAAYTGNTVYIEPYSADTTFQRVWCSFYDGMLGEPGKTITYHDVINIHGNADLWCNFFGHADADLYRGITVYDSNNDVVASTGTYPGIWLNHQDLGYTWTNDYVNFDVNFQDDMFIRNANEGLLYYFSNAPAQFAGYRWVITYRMYITTYDIFGNYLDGVVYWYPTVTHDETSPNHTYNFEMCPEDTADYAASVPWTDTYGSAYVIDANNVCGSAPDGNCAQIGAYASNSHAFICTHLDGYAFGGIWVKCESISTQSDFLVYVSSNGNDWTLTKEQTLYYVPGLHWIDCGINIAGYSYVLLAVYDNGSPSQMYIDAIQTGVNPT
jgi:hypothetical protein